MNGMLAAIAALAILSFSSPAFAQDEMTNTCEGAPDAAVVVVPELIHGIAAVHCTIFGHVIAGPEGVLWNYPGGFSPALVPAQMLGSEPEVVNHDYYFETIEARVLGADEADAAYSGFLEGFDERDDAAPKVIELSATNQEGIEQKVYFFSVSENSVWGYTCQPICTPEVPFMVLALDDE